MEVDNPSTLHKWKKAPAPPERIRICWNGFHTYWASSRTCKYCCPTHQRLMPGQRNPMRPACLAAKLKKESSNGILCQSVRHEIGQCVAVLRQAAIAHCREGKHLVYQWDGEKVSGYYEKKDYRPVSQKKTDKRVYASAIDHSLAVSLQRLGQVG